MFRYVGLPVYRIEAINIKRLLESVLAETATEDDWDVFTGMPIHHNPELDDIRVQCAMLALTEMTVRRGLIVFTDTGRAQIEEQLKILNRQILNNKFCKKRSTTMIEKTSPIARFLVIAAAFVIVVSGLKMAGALLVPFLLAVFIAMIVSPLLGWLKDRGIPGGLAILLIVILILLVGLLLTR